VYPCFVISSLSFLFFFFFFFFFSSRRRHTRFSRDWSSDVCSSDLSSCQPLIAILPLLLSAPKIIFSPPYLAIHPSKVLGFLTARSEERRVGKECRSRRSSYH